MTSTYALRTVTRPRSRLAAAGLAGVLGLGLTACGSADSADSADSAGSATTALFAGAASASPDASTAQADTATDAAFVANMVPHHMGGIKLGELAATKGVNSMVRSLGAAIKAKQTAELAMLKRLADQFGVQPAMNASIEARDMRDMAKLRAADGKAFDMLWLQVISGHHSAAIQMGEIEKAGGADAESAQLATDIIELQTKELAEFNRLIESMATS